MPAAPLAGPGARAASSRTATTRSCSTRRCSGARRLPRGEPRAAARRAGRAVAVVGARARSTTGCSTSSSTACSGFLAEVAGDPDHELRRQLDERVARAGRAAAHRSRRWPRRARSSRTSCSSTPRCGPGPARCGATPRTPSLAAGRRSRLRAAPPARRRARARPAARCRTTRRCRRRSTAGSSTAVGYLVEQYGHEIADLIAAHRRPLGRRRGQPPHRAAGRPGPAVHPHQRHGRRRPRRPGHLLGRPAAVGRPRGPTSSSGRPRRPRSG